MNCTYGLNSSKLTPVFKQAIPSGVKGKIGEAFTRIRLKLTGQRFDEQVKNGIGKSTFDFELHPLGNRNFVESKFGTSTLSTSQRAARDLPGTQLTIDNLTYPQFNGILGSSAAGGFAGNGTPQSAGGGFLLYPSKSNTNMLQSVYSK